MVQWIVITFFYHYRDNYRFYVKLSTDLFSSKFSWLEMSLVVFSIKIFNYRLNCKIKKLYNNKCPNIPYDFASVSESTTFTKKCKKSLFIEFKYTLQKSFLVESFDVYSSRG